MSFLNSAVFLTAASVVVTSANVILSGVHAAQIVFVSHDRGLQFLSDFDFVGFHLVALFFRGNL